MGRKMVFKDFKDKIRFLWTFKDRANFFRNLRTSGRPDLTIGLGCTVWPQCTRVTTNDQPTNQPTTNDVTTQSISISASFTNVK